MVNMVTTTVGINGIYREGMMAEFVMVLFGANKKCIRPPC